MQPITCDLSISEHAAVEVQRQDSTTVIYLCQHHANDLGPALIGKGYALIPLGEAAPALEGGHAILLPPHPPAEGAIF